MLTKGPIDESKRVLVTFSHHIDGGNGSVSVVGDFNDWSPDAHQMTVNGSERTCEIALKAGRSYRFRYLVNGERWENDWKADRYATNDFGGEDSVVDLTNVGAKASEPLQDADAS